MADEDLLVHVHIPKCAGTAIWYWMARHMPNSHGFLYPNTYPEFYYDAVAMSTGLGIENVALRCMSTHYFRIFPEYCAGRRMRYFTVIRDPLKQFLSYASYMRNMYREITDAESLASIPPDAGRMSLREIAAWLIDSPRDVRCRENFQSDFLTSYGWRITTGRGPAAGVQNPEWDPDDWEAYRKARLSLAKDVLSRFAVVGVVERLTETLTVLQQRAVEWNAPLGPLDDVGRINVTEGARDTDWIHDADPIGRRLLASIAEDYELYDYAEQLLDAALSERTDGQRRST